MDNILLSTQVMFPKTPIKPDKKSTTNGKHADAVSGITYIVSSRVGIPLF